MIKQQYLARGFTLLEVLIALAVLAIAMGALVKAAGQSVDNIEYLRDRTLASWVAANEINKQLLNPLWPETGVQNGVSAMAGREWYWQITFSNTDDGDIKRLDVTVGVDEDSNLLTLAAFKGRP